MKISPVIPFTLLLSLTLLGCSPTKSKNLESNSHQQANRTSESFPTIKRIPNNVICQNCNVTFKLAMAKRKHLQKHSYTMCPVCNHDYLKKSD